ncbi:MAG: NAD+ synthase [Deltaproteobacteria bacterium]|jgi:NAD+ synthase (glutamine-hydrolysing)|nr:NAD+ synthase [Deltaproteobacteria bacterium]
MKVGLLQCNFISNDVARNIEILYSAIERAAGAGAGLCVSSELALCGCPANRQFIRKSFIEMCRIKLQAFAALLSEKKLPPLLLGAPVINLEPQGKPLHNSAVFLRDGKVMVIARKVLPNREDNYYFEPGAALGVLQYNGWRFAVAVGEDIWNDRGFWHGHRQFRFDPVEEFMAGGADTLLNLTGLPFSIGIHDAHKKVLAWFSSKYRTPVVSVNQAGGMDNHIYHGGSMVFDACGSLRAQSPLFKEDVLVVDLNGLSGDSAEGRLVENEADAMEEIWQALALGLHDFVVKCGFTSVVLGLSGGVDSALVAAIAAEALGKENVLGMLMPSPDSLPGSLDDAARFAGNLGIDTMVIPIDKAMETFADVLRPGFTDLSLGAAGENIQARIRSTILMACANKFKRLLLNTGNKSEAALGHCTLYGDSAGAVGVIADLYKTQVCELAGWLNQTRGFELIPPEIPGKPPSAELHNGQEDMAAFPEYKVLDALLSAYLEDGNDEAELVERGFEAQTVKQVLRALRLSEFKRRQAPPVLRINTHSFGQSGHIPIATSF